MTSWALESSMPTARPGNPNAKSPGNAQEKLFISLITLLILLFSNCSYDTGVNGLFQQTICLLLPSSSIPLTNTLFRPHFQTSEFKDAALINKHVDGLLVLIDKHIATKPDTPLEVQVSVHIMFLSHNNPQLCSNMPTSHVLTTIPIHNNS